MNTIAVNPTTQPSLLRRVLLADSVVVGASGVLLALAAGPLGDLFELPVLLLRIVGLALLPYAAFVYYVASRERIPRSGAWAVVGFNMLWVVASLLLLVTGWVDPSGIGIAFIIAQALLVAAFADVEYLGLRRAKS